MNIRILSLLTVGGMLFMTSCGGSSGKKDSESDPMVTEIEETVLEDYDAEPAVEENVEEPVVEEPSSVSSSDIDAALDSFEKMVSATTKAAAAMTKASAGALENLENLENLINF